MKKIVAVTAVILAGCAFDLGYVQPRAGKTNEERDLAMLVCKDEAQTAANRGGPVATEAALGATIVGLPLAVSTDRAIQRTTFANCMKARGWVVTPPK